MSGTNALLAPQTGASALQAPAATPAPQSALPPVQPPSQPVAAPAPDLGDRISARVPVPPSDFHPDHHDGLHKAMGGAFDKAEASRFVREAYDAVRAIHPHIDPKAALLTARDAWHAVQHGLATHEQAHHAMRSFPALFGGQK